MTGEQAQSLVESMIQQGRPFDEIEEFIAERALPEDVKGALWLLAWARLDKTTQHGMVAEVIAFSGR